MNKCEYINDFISEISKKYNIDKKDLQKVISEIFKKYNIDKKDLQKDFNNSRNDKKYKEGSKTLVEIIGIQKQKEENSNIWDRSPYEDLTKLQSNNAGIVGETFMKKICDSFKIEASVYGSKIKNKADGLILNKSIEIKTSHRGSSADSFQHELGETPWIAEFMIFIDVSPTCIYITIFKNFSEEFYKSRKKCLEYFPTKTITWRKGTGAFKLDTTVKINEKNVLKGHTFKIYNDDDFNKKLKTFILTKFK